jgi:hypothetical protein
MSGKTYFDGQYWRFKDSGKLVHRWVAEKKVGGKIYEGRVVHHRDGDKENNDPRNLEIMSRSDHSRLHAEERYDSEKDDEDNDDDGGGIIEKIFRFFGG